MDIDEILKQVPIGEIAQKLGVSDDVARQAVQEGGAALLGGLAKNAETDEGSAAIRNALKKHEGASGASKVDDIDQADGGKIGVDGQADARPRLRRREAHLIQLGQRRDHGQRLGFGDAGETARRGKARRGRSDPIGFAMQIGLHAVQQVCQI